MSEDETARLEEPYVVHSVLRHERPRQRGSTPTRGWVPEPPGHLRKRCRQLAAEVEECTISIPALETSLDVSSKDAHDSELRIAAK